MQFFRNTRCPPKPIYSCFYSMSQILQKYSYSCVMGSTLYKVYFVLDLCEKWFSSVIHGLQSVFTFHLPSLSQSMSCHDLMKCVLLKSFSVANASLGRQGFLLHLFYVRNWVYSFLDWIFAIHILILTSMLIQQFDFD